MEPKSVESIIEHGRLLMTPYRLSEPSLDTPLRGVHASSKMFRLKIQHFLKGEGVLSVYDPSSYGGSLQATDHTDYRVVEKISPTDLKKGDVVAMYWCSGNVGIGYHIIDGFFTNDKFDGHDTPSKYSSVKELLRDVNCRSLKELNTLQEAEPETYSFGIRVYDIDEESVLYNPVGLYKNRWVRGSGAEIAHFYRIEKIQ